MEAIQRALDHLDPNMDRETWVRVGMALKAHLGQEGLTLFDAWSQGGHSYRRRDLLDTWKSLSGSGGVGIGSLFHLARENGYRPPDRTPSVEASPRTASRSAAEGGPRDSDNRSVSTGVDSAAAGGGSENSDRRLKYTGGSEATDLDDPDKQRQQAETARRAQDWMNRAVAADPHHPYLIRKGVGVHGLRQDGQRLLLPMFDPSGDLVNVQIIHPDGQKRFMRQGRKRGCFLSIGPLSGETILIGEGFATCATLYEATGISSVVAFDAGNLLPVALGLRARFPTLTLLIAADNDHQRSPNVGQIKGLEAAKAVSGRLALPEAGLLGDDGSDFNDLARRHGPEAVCRAIESCLSGPPEAASMDGGLFPLHEARIGPWLATRPPVRRWLLASILPLGKVALLVAPGGTGKSFFTVSLALSVVTGQPAFGGLAVGERGGVLLLYAEEDTAELHRRFHHVAAAMLADADDREGLVHRLENDLFVRSMAGQDNRLTVKIGHEILATDYVDRLLQTALEVPNLKLIVIDPASRFRGGEENAAEDVTRFVEMLERLALATGATVLVVHHANKASMVAGMAPSQATSRGSSAFTDGVRWQGDLSLLQVGEAQRFGIPSEQRRRYIRFSITKSNYGPPHEDVWLKRGEHGVLRLTTLAPGSVSEEALILDQVVGLIGERAAAGGEYSKRRFVDCFAGVGGALKVSRDRLRFLLDSALDEGVLILRPPLVPTKNIALVLALPSPDQTVEGVQEP